MAHSNADTDDGASTATDSTLYGADVGPTVDLADVSLPPAVGEKLQALYGTAEPPADAAEWIEATRAASTEALGREPTAEDLCRADDGAHRFEPADGGDTQGYVCVLDPILYPFLVDEPGTIRSETQVREETVTVDVTHGGVEVSHPEAVVSIGVAEHVDAVDEVTPEVIYRQVCGYIHVFADREEYETWAAEVDAATTAVDVETGVGIAKAIGDALFA